MTDTRDGAGRWPASPADLADAHRCPACFQAVTQPVCPGCGLHLTDPRMTQVLEIGRAMFTAERERQAIMTDVRANAAATAQTGAAATGPDAVPPPPPPAPPARPATPPAPPIIAEPAAAAVASGIAEPASAAAAQEAAAQEAAAEPALHDSTAPGPVLHDHAASGIALLPAETAAQASAPATPRVAPAAPASAPAAAPERARRRLTVPVLLLIVGVSLVGIAAIFFALLAWFVAGIALRAVIVGVVTLATIVAASQLRRRTLTATAEGIAVLGVVLLGLDAWAVRANDLFGAGTSQPAVWAGASALVVAVLCRAWARVSRLRAPDLAAAVALPAGLGLLIGGALALDTAEAITAGFLGAAAGGLVHALPAPWSAARRPPDAAAERVVLAAAGVAALVLAAGVGLLATTGIGTLIWLTVGVTVLGTAHAVLLRPRDIAGMPAAGALRATSASVAAFMAATIGWQLTARGDSAAFVVLIAPVAATLVAVAVDRARVRVPWLAPAALTAGIVGVLSIAAVLLSWSGFAIRTISGEWILWRTDAVATPLIDLAPPLLAVTAALIVTPLLFAAPSLRRPVVREALPVIAALLLLSAIARTAVPLAIVVAGALVATASLVALRRTSARRGWIAAGMVGAGAAYLAGTATPWLWLVAIAIAVLAPIGQRIVSHATGPAAVAFALAPVGVLLVSAIVAPSALSAMAGVGGGADAVFVLVQWVALATITAAIALRVDGASRTALALAAVASTAVGVGAGAIAGTSELARAALLEPALGIPRGILLLLAFGVVAIGRTRVAPGPALASAALLAPLGVATAHAIVRTASGAVALSGEPLVLAATAAVFIWAAAIIGARRTDAAAARTRLAVDLGALVAVLAVVALAVDAPTPPELRGALLAIIGVGIGGASVTRGWAAPGPATVAGFPATRAPGAPLAHAPRRLLAWPFVGALTAALWLWVDSTWPTAAPEAYVVAPAAGLLVFAGLLLWLRRLTESALATGLGLTLGLGTLALFAWPDAGVRGGVAAIVAAGVGIALTVTPVRRVVPVAIVGASVSLTALVIVSTGRALSGESFDALWLAATIAVALVCAAGLVRPVGQAARDDLPQGEVDFWNAASLGFGRAAPPVVLTITGVTAITAALYRDDFAVAAGVLVVALGLHLAAAAQGRIPLDAPLRWTAAGVGATASAAFATWGVVHEIEIVSVPLGLTLLASAALAARRPERSASVERMAWLTGLTIATVPSIVAPPEPLRVWLVIGLTLVAALALVHIPAPDVARLRGPSAIVLTAVALAVAARSTGAADALPELAAIVAGVGAIGVATGLVRVSARERDPLPPIVAAAGAAFVVSTVALRLDGELLPTVIATAAGGLVGVGAALLLGSPRWFGVAAVLALGGAVTTGIAAAMRGAHVAALTGGAARVEPDLWAVVGLGIVVAIVVAALRASSAHVVGIAGGILLSGALALFTAAELALVDGDLARWRMLLTMTVLSVGGAAGWAWRTRFGVVPLIVASALGTSAVVVAVLSGTGPAEIVTLPPALVGLAVGAWRMRSDSQLRSWPALGSWLALLTLPSLAYDLSDDPELWRIVGLGVVALALVVVGAVSRLQAPLVLGSATLLVHAVAQLWPWIAAAYVAVWWLWLGLGGAALIFLAARYEKRMRAIRGAFTAVRALR